MTGQKEFLKIFGNVTISDIIVIALALIFLGLVYRKIHKYIVDKHDADVAHAKELKEAIDGVRNLPKYREQSLEIQEKFRKEITDLRRELNEQNKRIENLEESRRKRELNRLRDILIKSYNYYTNKDTNPTHTWTKMEADAFWDMFRDYEELGGDGYMHSIVEPAMRTLKSIDVGNPISK